MLTSQNVLNVETPNLNAILAEYGISINFGAVFEQDTSKMLQNAPEFVIADVSSSFMSNINMAMKMCFVDAGSIQFQDSDKLNELGVTYETIASTGSTSFIRTNFDIQSYSRTEQDSEEGSFIVGADVTKKISDEFLLSTIHFWQTLVFNRQSLFIFGNLLPNADFVTNIGTFTTQYVRDIIRITTIYCVF